MAIHFLANPFQLAEVIRLQNLPRQLVPQGVYIYCRLHFLIFYLG